MKNIFKRIFKNKKFLQKRNIFTEIKKDFIKPKDFVKIFNNNNINYFTGVPDSLLKDLTNYLSVNKKNYHITANEGSAISLATGYHLATKNIPCVFLQNSGIGNTINPLLSLAKVYKIPMILLVGWRGEPHKKDEPQHLIQGEVNEKLLESINIKHSILPDNINLVNEYLKNSIEYVKCTNEPYVYLVRRQTFENYDLSDEKLDDNNLKRFDVLSNLINTINIENSLILTTTGFTSREMLYLNEVENKEVNSFYNVGAMGHVSMISLGIANNTNKKVFCIDGDGSLIMHMGNMITIGNQLPSNFIHILINNGKHESVGNQETYGKNINFSNIAKECGYKNTFNAQSIEEFNDIISDEKLNGPIFIQINCDTGTINNLPRPSKTLLEYKKNFQKYI